MTTLVAKHSKTAQEDVPERSQENLPSKNPARTNPVFPDPTTIPELSPRSTLSNRDSLQEEVSREASEDDKGARGITTPYRISRRFLLIRLHRSS